MRITVLCTQLRKTIHTVVGTHSTRVRAGAAGNVVSRDVINGLLCVALLCRMFSQCFTLLAAAAAPISSKQAVRGAPIIAHSTCDDHCCVLAEWTLCATHVASLPLGVFACSLNRQRSLPWMTPVSMILSTPSVLARVPTR